MIARLHVTLNIHYVSNEFIRFPIGVLSWRRQTNLLAPSINLIIVMYIYTLIVHVSLSISAPACPCFSHHASSSLVLLCHPC